jgi:HK97 family phage prohead protease
VDSVTDLRNLPDVVRERLADGYGPDFLSERHRGFDCDYRGKTLEHRATPRVELRAAADGTPIIAGYATVYEHAYDVAGGPPYGWTEMIARGAADKSVKEQDDVYLFFDHEGLPLSSTKAATLTLESDKVGLYNESRIDPRSAWSMEIVHRLERRELDAMSFAFRATRQEWNEDYTERRILEVRLFDVSVVSFPANPATVVQLRARSDDAPPSTRLAEAQQILAEIRSASSRIAG